MNKPEHPFLRLDLVNLPYRDELVAAATRVIDSGHYIGGPEVQGFEKELGSYLETPEVVAVSNGLDALRLILRGYIELGKLNPGDGVLVPANTFLASVLAITDCRLTPVFVDPDPATMNFSVKEAMRVMSPCVRAVMPVHLYGRVCWDDEIAGFACDNNLLVIEDNAQALGASASVPGLFGTCHSGSLGHAAGVSFYPTKNVGALGDAGAVTTHDKQLATVIRALQNYGSDRRYHNIYCGYNCRMDAIQAAMLRVKLAHINEENTLRITQADTYRRLITNPAIILPEPAKEFGHIYHQFVIRTEKRDALQQFLMERGIQTDIHYPTPPHRQPCYKAYDNTPLPVADHLAATCLSLPVSRSASQDTIAAISNAINAWHP